MVERLVTTAVERARPDLAERLSYDSEASMFAAYCRSRSDAVALTKVIDSMVGTSRGSDL